jgi:cell division transport system ATP-binding protein
LKYYGATTALPLYKKEKDMPIIKYKDVDIHIDSKVILEKVSFTLEAGEFAYIIGAVGSGKSTLLKTIYGEVDIVDGTAVVMDEYEMSRISNRKLQALRKNTGIVFQDFQLLTDRSVHDNLDFVLRCTGWKNREQREERIQEVLDLVGLPQKGYKRPHELSGGEQQRIVIARAILNRPALLLADEPTGNLDYETGKHIMSLLHRICKEEKMAVLMITHYEQWLKEFPGTVYRCKDREMNKVLLYEDIKEATKEIPTNQEQEQE